MSKLRDLLHPWAIKPSHYDDDFPGGSGGGGLPTGMDYQLFEVTNLVVPSGTDWSSGSSHVLGTIPFDFFFSAIQAYPEWVHYKLSLETAAVLNGTDELHIGIVRDSTAAVDTVFDDAGVDSTRRYQTEIRPGVGDTNAYSSSVPPDGESSVVIYTDNGPTTADITIVRARAAFLIA